MQKCSMKTGTGSPRSHVAGATEIRLRQSRLPNGSDALAVRSRMNRKKQVTDDARCYAQVVGHPCHRNWVPPMLVFAGFCQALIYAQKCSVYVVSRLSNGTQTARFFCLSRFCDNKTVHSSSSPLAGRGVCVSNNNKKT